MIRHQAAIAGVVTVVPTGTVVVGALVALKSAPQAFTDMLEVLAAAAGPAWDAQVRRPDRARTASDGHYVFIDLPDGPYTLIASVPDGGSRYGTAQARVSVARDGDGRIALAKADFAVPATSVSGKITSPPPTAPVPVPGAPASNPPSPSPVAMAEIRVEGSGERSYSDGQGRFLLTAIEKGSRVITVTPPGHAPAKRPVQFAAAGASPTVDVALTPEEWAKADPNVTRSDANG